MTDQAHDHCPRCRSTDLWEVTGGKNEMQCMDCGLAFKREEMLVGVDPDI